MNNIEITNDQLKLLAGIIGERIDANRSQKKRKEPKEDFRMRIINDILSQNAYKYAEATDNRISVQTSPTPPRPSDDDLRRMYDLVQADARLTRRISGLGFGNKGDSYRKAAIKLQIMSLMQVLRDGKNVRNSIVHTPGFVPSQMSTDRAMKEYAQADDDITRYLSRNR